jgi:hypothetical protein
VILLALAFVAIAGSAAQSPAIAAPVDCVYNRLDRSYANGIWLGMRVGIPDEDPVLNEFYAAEDACRQQYGWDAAQLGMASFYALTRARYETLLAEMMSDPTDRTALDHAVQRYFEANLMQLLPLLRDGPIGAHEHPVTDSATGRARAAFRRDLERSNPRLARRFNDEQIWPIAWAGFTSGLLRWSYGHLPAGR